MKSAPTAAEILATIPPRKARSLLVEWLESDPDRAERFWTVIDTGISRGIGVAPLLTAWNAHHDGEDVCPVQQSQVRNAYNERCRGSVSE